MEMYESAMGDALSGGNAYTTSLLLIDRERMRLQASCVSWRCDGGEPRASPRCLPAGLGA
jgi:hypothetical protein